MSCQKCFIAADEITAEQSYQLLEWCHSQGASDFTLTIIGIGDQESERSISSQTRALLAPFQLPTADRPRVEWNERSPQVRLTELWQLTPMSIAALQQVFDRPFTDTGSNHDAGLFNAILGDDTGWVELPEIYRDGDLLLAVISHESRAVLWISAQERAELTAMGIAISDDPDWLYWVD